MGGGGQRLLIGCMHEGGGGIQMRTVCNRGVRASTAYGGGKPKAHIPLESAFASANFRVSNAENDAQTT